MSRDRFRALFESEALTNGRDKAVLYYFYDRLFRYVTMEVDCVSRLGCTYPFHLIKLAQLPSSSGRQLWTSEPVLSEFVTLKLLPVEFVPAEFLSVSKLRILAVLLLSIPSRAHTMNDFVSSSAAAKLAPPLGTEPLISSWVQYEIFRS